MSPCSYSAMKMPRTSREQLREAGFLQRERQRKEVFAVSSQHVEGRVLRPLVVLGANPERRSRKRRTNRSARRTQLALPELVAMHGIISSSGWLGRSPAAPYRHPGGWAHITSGTRLCCCRSRLPLYPPVTTPIPTALTLTPEIALARTPVPIVRPNNHVCFRGVLIDFVSVPTNVAGTDNLCRRACPGKGQDASTQQCTKQHFPL
jgi:hypothetical protein